MQVLTITNNCFNDQRHSVSLASNMSVGHTSHVPRVSLVWLKLCLKVLWHILYLLISKGWWEGGYSTHLYNFPPDLSQVSSWWVLGGWDNPWPKVPHAHNPCITTQAGLKAAATKDASRVGALSSTLCDFGMIIYCFKVSNFQRTLYFWAVEKGSENNLAYYMFQDKKYIYVYRSLL